MTRDPRYDVLFDPVQIGPVWTKNRFYQVPHCNGMGHHYPSSMAKMRGTKAEGGWGVVCTEEVEISPKSEHSPLIEGRMWDDSDIPVFARMVEQIHEHGALAGFQPSFTGFVAPNFYSREIPIAPVHTPVESMVPIQARAMDKADIKALRKLYVDAARRAKAAGFDLIYNYAGHSMEIQMHFMSRRYNTRTDEYGGSLENRVRLFREVLESTKDAVGDTCGVPVRFAVDELIGSEGISCDAEGHDIVEMLAEIPDMWDVNLADWSNDSTTSRFYPEGNQQSYTAFVKGITSKPVVGVGRFTSPDTMVAMIKSGQLDLIGAARPSIADPFLPKKIEEGRSEDIRECIGCNICVTADFLATPLRCTQNPTMGEEWRRGWHPENIDAKKSNSSFLIVGGGPAGLECARALGQRGYDVAIAEERPEFGGRVTTESGLPGLSEWARVRDYRLGQIAKMSNVVLHPGSPMSAANVNEYGADHVVIATGSKWRHDGLGRANHRPIPGSDGPCVFTPDDIMAGETPTGPVLIFDDDHYYLGGILAEKFRSQGADVTLVTPAADISHFTHFTLEQVRIQTRLLELGVHLKTHKNLSSITGDQAVLRCVFTDREETCIARSVVMVTSRLPRDDLYYELKSEGQKPSLVGDRALSRIGDCYGPGTIAAAVYSGHKFAREVDEPIDTGVPFRRELPQLAED